MHISIITLLPLLVASHVNGLAHDSGVYGPSLELVHQYYDQFPTGIAVSSTGRMFSCYPLGLDANNTRYQVAELTDSTTEVPYPSAEFNYPPGGATTVNYADHLISVQSVVVDAKDRLWILDTGRATTANNTLLLSSYGGPKLVGIDLATNKVFKTILFPRDAVYADSYPNDVRFDLRPTLPNTSGHGIAYLTDSSPEGRNGLIVVDLGTGKAWRQLDGLAITKAEPDFRAFIWGDVVDVSTGTDGIALSADGETLYFGVVSGRDIYSVPTAVLRDDSSEGRAKAVKSVTKIVQKGVSDGYETDSEGRIFVGSFESNAINVVYPGNDSVETFVRDPRMGWTDTMSVVSLGGNGTEERGYLYFTENQLWRQERERPFALFRVELPGGAGKVVL
ncbi:MRJP-domain-containing protein [Aspergillus vadensis CBS 113365]|uniref:MRJP-domain-containing protein n=1 Tax=Aspergillus vadensis (strain CBS 113365 / IMI 142717 / IBT 24658) TaxID=1448311 RepID=A0A319BB71_ASPVC|nr:MRJP-domain-containing protein [Aspergillus vadensis CBS 113365]PYH69967.1 MRJP-domain-containing protein [Aspergillus vadensis CBS 113365]